MNNKKDIIYKAKYCFLCNAELGKRKRYLLKTIHFIDDKAYACEVVVCFKCYKHKKIMELIK